MKNGCTHDGRAAHKPATTQQHELSLPRRIEVIVRYLLYKLPGAQVALLGLYPRGDPPGYKYAQPSIFTAAENQVNDRMKCVDACVHVLWVTKRGNLCGCKVKGRIGAGSSTLFATPASKLVAAALHVLVCLHHPFTQ